MQREELIEKYWARIFYRPTDRDLVEAKRVELELEGLGYYCSLIKDSNQPLLLKLDRKFYEGKKQINKLIDELRAG